MLRKRLEGCIYSALQWSKAGIIVGDRLYPWGLQWEGVVRLGSVLRHRPGIS